MKPTTLEEKYRYYRRYIEKIVEFPVGSPPQVKEIGLARGAIQRGYTEMEKSRFAGSLTEYIIWIGGLHAMRIIITRLTKNWPPDRNAMKQAVRQLVSEDTIDAAALVRATRLIRVIDLHLVLDNVSFGDEFDNEKNMVLVKLLQYMNERRNELESLERGGDDVNPATVAFIIERNGFKPLIITNQ